MKAWISPRLDISLSPTTKPVSLIAIAELNVPLPIVSIEIMFWVVGSQKKAWGTTNSSNTSENTLPVSPIT